MSRSLGDTLTGELLARLASESAGEWVDVAIPIATVDRLGRPHPALLSYDEVAAPDATTLRLATYAGSHTSDNLRLRGVVTLYLLAPGEVHYLEARARELDGGLRGHPLLAVFEARIEDVLVDESDAALEGAAVIASAPRVRRAGAAAGLRGALLRA